ncbi:integrase [Citrobacter sp. NCU1]|uniref:tyrosine-type recombinase/integrase n=1 Tax=Citrobacter sp. NCU1 TaxID=2026683 RepID=UPI0013919CA6|nr:site-specific integrase [Citrobacter sp. NCU1]NDO80221.1 integrase [Citrobacter sp. NCU1]
MPKLTDAEIKAWVKADIRFEGRSDGNGLYLRYRAVDRVPVWRFRYKFGGKPRAVVIGSYIDFPLAKARQQAKELSARVALGFDVAGEKKQRKAEALEKIETEKNAVRVDGLITDFYERHILPSFKNPEIYKKVAFANISPVIGSMKVEDVKPRHIDEVLTSIRDRGALTVANDVLRMMKKIFDFAVVRGLIEVNPALPFTAKDAGGKEEGRKRFLSRSELVQFFSAMHQTRAFTRENELTVKLLLALCVRKMELCAALWDEFDLDAAVWHLPGERTKNGDDIDIPLAQPVIGWLEELRTFSCNSRWLLPARKLRLTAHVSSSVLNTAMPYVLAEMPGVERFSVHDFRRTARTHLAMLGVDPVIAERCLNHRIPGVEGIYNRHQYFEERKAALALWVNFLVALENGEDYNVVSLIKQGNTI